MPYDATILEQVIESLHDAVYFVDNERRISYWNQAAERLTGFPREAVLGARCADNILVHVDENGQSLCKRGCPARQTMRDGRSREVVVFFRHRDGHRVPVLTRVLPLLDEQGQVVGAFEVFRELTSDSARETRLAELERLAMYDELTQMPNRRYLDDRLRSRLDDYHGRGWSFGLLIADLDHFKQVNDTFGHDVGDLVLRTIGATLLNGVRSGDVIGRWGGEEFLALISAIDQRGLATVAERLCNLVRSTRINGPQKGLEVTISIGGALAQDGDDGATLLRRADGALYRAKAEGRDRFVLAD